jgi:hypothetical protein
VCFSVETYKTKYSKSVVKKNSMCRERQTMMGTYERNLSLEASTRLCTVQAKEE